MSILKSLMSPIQARILSKHMCPACTRNLDKMQQREPLTTETEMVTCTCGRQYIFNRPHRRYRRALKEEVRPNFSNLY